MWSREELGCERGRVDVEIILVVRIVVGAVVSTPRHCALVVGFAF
jgi:hypothetical protein